MKITTTAATTTTKKIRIVLNWNWINKIPKRRRASKVVFFSSFIFLFFFLSFLYLKRTRQIFRNKHSTARNSLSHWIEFGREDFVYGRAIRVCVCALFLLFEPYFIVTVIIVIIVWNHSVLSSIVIRYGILSGRESEWELWEEERDLEWETERMILFTLWTHFITAIELRHNEFLLI